MQFHDPLSAAPSTGAAQPAPTTVFRRGALCRPLAALALFLSAAGPASAADDYIYVVRAGDSPWNITTRYLKSIDHWPQLQQYNRIISPDTIPPGTQLRIPAGWLRSRGRPVRITDLQGQVEVLNRGVAQMLERGMTIVEGSLLRTGANGSLTLLLPDGSRSLVGPDTELRLSTARQIEASSGGQIKMELLRGYVETKVTDKRKSGGRFIIDTPSGVTAVRGTRFRVTEAGRVLRTETLEGEVELRNRAGRSIMKAGTGVSAPAGQAPGAAQALLPAPRLDALPERIDRLPASLELPAVPGAVRYRSQFAPEAGFSVIESDQLASRPQARAPAELPDGVHRIRVRAIADNGLEGFDAERTIVIDARPEPPFPSQPAGGSVVTDDTPAFSWAKVADATQYHFQLATDAGFQQRVAEQDGLTEAGFTLADGLAPGAYFWRVAVTTAAEGRGPFSDPQAFRRPPPGPQAEPPRLGIGSLELRWRASGADHRYQVQLSTDPAFAAPEHDLQTDAPALSMEAPAPGVHHVRIRSLEPGSPPGPWGKPQQIEIPRDYWKTMLLVLPALLFVL